MKFVIAVFLVSTTACAHGAASGTTAPEAENAAASNDQVCREERAMGSLISKKVCRPKSDGAGNEIDAMTRRAGQDVRKGS
jgi:hypothetical protein